MSGNSTGNMFRVTTFGSSHGKALGAVIDGCPAGLKLNQEDIQAELDRRRPGTSKITTARGETDRVEVLSGIFQGKTDGTPIAAVVYNKDADSSAYEALKNKPRPGHGDYTVRCADQQAALKMEEAIMEAKAQGDSLGGIVETLAFEVPAGLGEPVFSKLDADLAQALMGIGSVKGVEVGFGFGLAQSTASATNDEYYLEKGQIKTTTNTSGGIVGGISNGMPLVVRMAVKPTPSISLRQKTVDLEKREEVEIKIEGRHDPCICPRVTAVAESAVAMVLAEHLLRSGFLNPCRL